MVFDIATEQLNTSGNLSPLQVLALRLQYKMAQLWKILPSAESGMTSRADDKALCPIL